MFFRLQLIFTIIAFFLFGPLESIFSEAKKLVFLVFLNFSPS